MTGLYLSLEMEKWLGAGGAQWRDTWWHFRPNGGKVGADSAPWRWVGLMGTWSIHWAAGLEAGWRST